MTEAPINDFTFIHEPRSVIDDMVLALPLLALIFVAIIALTLSFLFNRKKKDPSLLAEYVKVRLKQIKYLSALAILLSLALTLTAASRIMINQAIVGIEFAQLDRMLGPLAEALFFAALGMLTAIAGLVCMLIVLGRGPRNTA